MAFFIPSNSSLDIVSRERPSAADMSEIDIGKINKYAIRSSNTQMRKVHEIVIITMQQYIK